MGNLKIRNSLFVLEKSFRGRHEDNNLSYKNTFFIRGIIFLLYNSLFMILLLNMLIVVNLLYYGFFPNILKTIRQNWMNRGSI